jgi:hypothetical protein
MKSPPSPPHSPEHIAQFARSFMEKHGTQAEERACEEMFAVMSAGDAKHSAFWLAVIHEIRQLGNPAIH